MNKHFSDFALAEPLRRGLEKAGYETPTPVQQQAIAPALAGVDLMVSAATGSGKTAAFLLPMMQRFLDRPAHATATRGLVLVPTRELARQIAVQLIALGSYTRISAGVITGGELRAHQIATLRKNPEVLVATPGRLLDHLRAGHADLRDLEVLVLDEADRMLDMGFAEDVLAIIQRSNPERQSMLFSATLHHRGLSAITVPLLRDPKVLVVNPVREQHPDIAHQLILSDGPGHKEQQILWLLQNESFDKVLVFVNMRERTVALANMLMGKGVRVAALHGELEQRERNRVMRLFRRGEVSVLVATDLAARGLDVPGVDLVINLDPPRTGDAYLHRTGRTGRAGETGLAITLVAAQEWNRMEGIARYLALDLMPRELPGLAARFKGPAPHKGRPRPKAAPTKDKPVKARAKDRVRDRKAIGKRRKPSAQVTVEAGHGPLKRGGPSGPTKGG